ncbi:MAG TPA: hypothetical protein VGB52_01980 [Actinomycetota bacterium]|jgi:hypothetical protein
MQRLTLCVLLLVLTAACSGEGTVPPPGQQPSASLIGRGLQLPAGDPLRIGFQPFTGAARVIVRFEPSDAVVDVCALRMLDEPVDPSRAGCVRDVRAGVRETVTGAGMRGVAIVVRSEQRVTTDLVLEYEEGERAITIALPVVPPPPGGRDCSDNACNPFFELQPTRAGRFSAHARWDGPDGALVLLQGSVLGRSQTATGIPYAEPARDEGTPPLELETSMTAPAEYAIALRHLRAGATIPPMRNVVLEVTWPS